VELKVNYFYPIHMHDKLMARTEVVFRGKKLCVVYGRLYRNGNESQVLAMVTATFNIVVPKVPAGPSAPGA
jgi:acyl-coenzyme A thioesterase PaaI-like protein